MESMGNSLYDLFAEYYEEWGIYENIDTYMQDSDDFFVFLKLQKRNGKTRFAEIAERIIAVLGDDWQEPEAALVEDAEKWSRICCEKIGISETIKDQVEDYISGGNIRQVISAYLLIVMKACGEKREKIIKKYIDTLLNGIIANYYKKYSINNKITSDVFFPLAWEGEGELPKSYSDVADKGSFRLLGTAGSGKTTQAWHYYTEALKLAKEKRLILPVWIELKDFSEYKKGDLKEKIIDLISEVSESREVAEELCRYLLEAQKMVLFLDGYNEAIKLDDDGKRALREDIDSFYRAYCKIILTDRIANSSSLFFERVPSYKLRSMTEEDIEGYLKEYEDKKVYSKANYSEIRMYIKKVREDVSPDIKFQLVPAKIDMVLRCYQSDWLENKATKHAFEEAYLEYLLNREEAKGERAEVLKNLLCATVDDEKEVFFSGADTSIESQDFQEKLWNNFPGIDYLACDRYRSLFVEMGIFEKVGNHYKFANEVYFEYFKNIHRITN